MTMPDGRTLNFVKHGLLLGVPGKAELFTQHPIGMPESSCSMQDYRNRRRHPWQHEDTPPGCFGPPPRAASPLAVCASLDYSENRNWMEPGLSVALFLRAKFSVGPGACRVTLLLGLLSEAGKPLSRVGIYKLACRVSA